MKLKDLIPEAETKDLSVGTKLVFVTDGIVNIVSGDDAYSFEVDKGDMFTITRVDKSWYHGKITLKNKNVKLVRRPNASGWDQDVLDRKAAPNMNKIVFAVQKANDGPFPLYAKWKVK